MAQGAPAAAGGAHLHAHLQSQLALAFALISARLHQPLLLQPLCGSFHRLLQALEAFIQHRMGIAVAIGEPVEPRASNRRQGGERQAGGLHGRLRRSKASSLKGPAELFGALQHTQRCPRANSVQREEEQIGASGGGREGGSSRLGLMLPTQPIPALQLPGLLERSIDQLQPQRSTEGGQG